MVITIIDYGAGNIANVKNAFENIGVNANVSKSERDWKIADALILPGVGAFGAAINKLGRKASIIRMLIEQGRPFLGICLGMQLLLEKSDESKGVMGLDIFQGRVKRFRTRLPVPQIGWNKIKPITASPLFEGMGEFYAYFVHSYYCEPKDKRAICATTKYGKQFPSALWQNNIFATQFHPEKSGKNGLRILRNFIKEVKK